MTKPNALDPRLLAGRAIRDEGPLRISAARARRTTRDPSFRTSRTGTVALSEQMITRQEIFL